MFLSWQIIFSCTLSFFRLVMFSEERMFLFFLSCRNFSINFRAELGALQKRRPVLTGTWTRKFVLPISNLRGDITFPHYVFVLCKTRVQIFSVHCRTNAICSYQTKTKNTNCRNVSQRVFAPNMRLSTTSPSGNMRLCLKSFPSAMQA